MMFSKPRLVSIGLLLAILFISLMFTSYAEGLDNASIAYIVNKDAPKTQQATDSKASATYKQKIDGVTLGKTITVADITGVLQNNPGVQKILNKSL
jgi:hypothetical protein